MRFQCSSLLAAVLCLGGLPAGGAPSPASSAALASPLAAPGTRQGPAPGAAPEAQAPAGSAGQAAGDGADRRARELEQLRQEELEAQRRRLSRELLGPLREAAERYAKQERLPRSRWFGEDQQSNQASIDRLLDQAIEALELSGLTDTRGKLRAERQRMEELRRLNAGDRETRLSAASEAELSRIGKVLELSREDLDARIAERELAIAEAEQTCVQLEQGFLEGLRQMGLAVDPAAGRALLGTVSGEDFVEMCVAFDNVRLLTEQLEKLTRESGESLELARRYYGSYLVLIRILDRVQDDFVRRVRQEQLPKLGELAERARKNIREAGEAMRSGGDRGLLEQNMRSNRLTEEACQNYARYLGEQAAAVEAQNKAVELRLRDAQNTYKTVELSSQVTELLREGERNFKALLRLQVPPLKGFENAELEREFRRLTERLVEP
jgi:hypothetical protein